MAGRFINVELGKGKKAPAMSQRELFEAALEISDREQRQAFLDQACAGNPALRTAVESLLKSHHEAGSFLDVPAVDQARGQREVPSQQTIDFAAPQHFAADKGQEEPDLSYLSPSSKVGSIGKLAHYEVIQVLGQGGFGTVLKAFDEKLHRMVAIKVLDPRMASTSPPRKRFLRKARAAAGIRHENIVQVYSVEEKPVPYLVMEYIDGQTLQEKQNGQGPLETGEIVHIGRQIASGLAAAHAAGLIHRDIKPANVLLEKGIAQKVKITDFGLARAADDASLSISGLIAGTPMYMAPEQASGQALDHRTDLFSLGSVLYQITTGRPPFRAASTVAVLRRVVEDTPRPIHEIIPEAPEWLVAIIGKLHQKNPDDRFQSAAEVSEIFAKCQAVMTESGKSQIPAELLKTITIASHPSLVQKVPRWAASAQNVTTFLGTLLLFLIVSAGLIWWGTKLTGLSTRSMHGILAGVTCLVSVSCWLVEYLLSRRNLHAMAQTTASIAGAACLLAAGNGFMMRFASSGAAPVVTTTQESVEKTEVVPQVKTNNTEPSRKSAPATDSAGWQGWPTDAPAPAMIPFDSTKAKEHQKAWAAYLKVPEEYTNSLGMKFRLVPPGEFTMGSTEFERAQALLAVHPDDKMRKAYIESEAPQHPVIITQPYYAGIHEVTQKQYETIVGKNPSVYQPSNPDKKYADKVSGIDADNLPVDSLSWNDAFKLAVKLNERSSSERGYRLLTEAEWELACRAGTTENYWTGADHASLSKGAWIIVNAEARPHPVGLLLANPFGLYDTHGNVWEWVQDAWHPDFYRETSGKPAVDPCCVTGMDNLYVQRGGDWTYVATHTRSAARGADQMTSQQFFAGVRLGLSVEGVREALENMKPTSKNTPETGPVWPADAPLPAIAPFDAE